MYSGPRRWPRPRVARSAGLTASAVTRHPAAGADAAPRREERSEHHDQGRHVNVHRRLPVASTTRQKRRRRGPTAATSATAPPNSLHPKRAPLPVRTEARVERAMRHQHGQRRAGRDGGEEQGANQFDEPATKVAHAGPRSTGYRGKKGASPRLRLLVALLGGDNIQYQLSLPRPYLGTWSSPRWSPRQGHHPGVPRRPGPGDRGRGDLRRGPAAVRRRDARRYGRSSARSGTLKCACRDARCTAGATTMA